MKTYKTFKWGNVPKLLKKALKGEKIELDGYFTGVEFEKLYGRLERLGLLKELSKVQFIIVDSRILYPIKPFIETILDIIASLTYEVNDGWDLGSIYNEHNDAILAGKLKQLLIDADYVSELGCVSLLGALYQEGELPLKSISKIKIADQYFYSRGEIIDRFSEEVQCELKRDPSGDTLNHVALQAHALGIAVPLTGEQSSQLALSTKHSDKIQRSACEVCKSRDELGLFLIDNSHRITALLRINNPRPWGHLY